MPGRVRASLVGAALCGLAVFASACGADGKKTTAAKTPAAAATATATAEAKDKPLEPAEDGFVVATEYNVARYCLATLRDGAASASLNERTKRGVDNLIQMTRDRPDAIYKTADGSRTRTLRQVLADQAGNTEACDPSLSRKLDRAVQTLP